MKIKAILTFLLLLVPVATAFGQQKAEIASVSYTHLTLPTKA